MWMELKNRTSTVYDELRDGNLSQVHFPGPSQASLTNLLRNGSIAAALFISFILALYTVLWKCMVSPPRRGKRKRILKGVRGV
ncbi:uncharacterized protein sb:cb288 isoform X2 [Astyanax mexicanus]|uniref:uncharacterized protein sb:cb288 isoform X2 n=1 Tax=Astyanax mexicanus TaxID=7994 RepID=UPI0020CB169F|nr:uncharacterized protein sb:cb288 isoform X2 [Astyanax mexicanus]